MVVNIGPYQNIICQVDGHGLGDNAKLLMSLGDGIRARNGEPVARRTTPVLGAVTEGNYRYRKIFSRALLCLKRLPHRKPSVAESRNWVSTMGDLAFFPKVLFKPEVYRTALGLIFWQPQCCSCDPVIPRRLPNRHLLL